MRVTSSILRAGNNEVRKEEEVPKVEAKKKQSNSISMERKRVGFVEGTKLWENDDDGTATLDAITMDGMKHHKSLLDSLIDVIDQGLLGYRDSKKEPVYVFDGDDDESVGHYSVYSNGSTITMLQVNAGLRAYLCNLAWKANSDSEKLREQAAEQLQEIKELNARRQSYLAKESEKMRTQMQETKAFLACGTEGTGVQTRETNAFNASGSKKVGERMLETKAPNTSVVEEVDVKIQETKALFGSCQRDLVCASESESMGMGVFKQLAALDDFQNLLVGTGGLAASKKAIEGSEEMLPPWRPAPVGSITIHNAEEFFQALQLRNAILAAAAHQKKQGEASRAEGRNDGSTVMREGKSSDGSRDPANSESNEPGPSAPLSKVNPLDAILVTWQSRSKSSFETVGIENFDENIEATDMNLSKSYFSGASVAPVG